MSDDPRVTVPAELVDALREAYGYAPFVADKPEWQPLMDAAHALLHEVEFPTKRLDATERPDEGGRPAGKSQGVASAGEPPDVGSALTAPPPVPVSDEAEAKEAAVQKWWAAALAPIFTGTNMQAMNLRLAYEAGWDDCTAHLAEKEEQP